VVAQTSFSLLATLFRLVFLASPLTFVLYAIAPLVVFLQFTFDLLILSPYALIAYFLHAIYPVYVFVGVACITGSLIGFSGRTLALFLTALILSPGDQAIVQ
jgi:hypothetical protein